MKKLLIIFTVIFSLFLTNVTEAKCTETNSVTQCVTSFYPGTLYVRPYSVRDTYINGVLCYAVWYSVNVSIPTRVYSLNNYTCNFDVINSYSYSYFKWFAY